MRLGHAAGIAALAWQPGGRLIATAGIDNSALLWDSSTGRPIALLGGHRGPVTHLSWSATGALLATASTQGGATLWEVPSGAALRVVGEPDATVTALDWRPDGALLAIGTGGKVPGVELWEARGSLNRRLGAVSHPIASLRWSDDGRYLAAGLASGEVLLWEPELPDPVQRPLAKLNGPVTAMSWKPKAHRLACASVGESRVLVLDAPGEKPGVSFDLHLGGICSLAWSPNGERLASGASDGNVVLWDPEGRPVQKLSDHVGPVRCLAWTPNSRQIATGSDDRSAIVWDAESGDAKSVLTGLGRPVTSLGWNGEGTRLAGSSESQSYGLLWDPVSQEIRLRLAGSASLRQRLAWLGPSRILATTPENGIGLWNLETAIRQAPPGGSRGARAIAAHPSGKLAFNTAAKPALLAVWSPNDPPKKPPATVKSAAAATVAQWNIEGTHLAIGDALGGVALGEAVTALQSALPAHRRAVTAIAWDPLGKLFVSGSEDGSLALFSQKPWRKVVSLLGSVPVESLAFSPDGARLAVEGTGGRGDVWDIPNRKLLRAFTGRLPAWSPNGKLLALDRGIWNPATGAFTAGLSRDPQSVTALAWRPNGASVAVAAEDGSIVLREPATGGALATLVAAGRPIVSLAWSPDGTALAAATSDGVIHLWKVAGAQEIASMYVFDGGANWLILTPRGHFSASLRGADRLQWRLGDELLPVDRFRARFEDRKAVAAALRSRQATGSPMADR